MADTAQSSSAEEMNVKIKTMQPATYELKISVQVWLPHYSNWVQGRSV